MSQLWDIRSLER